MKRYVNGVIESSWPRVKPNDAAIAFHTDIEPRTAKDMIPTRRAFSFRFAKRAAARIAKRTQSMLPKNIKRGLPRIAGADSKARKKRPERDMSPLGIAATAKKMMAVVTMTGRWILISIEAYTRSATERCESCNESIVTEKKDETI